MIAFVMSLGIWNWVILGLILLTSELFVPGFFLIWIGLGALLTAIVISLFSGFSHLEHWQVQALLFLIFSVGFVIIGYHFFKSDKQSDEPLLNQRPKQLIGTVLTLREPIIDNHGRVSIGDTVWRVKGPNANAGNRVKLLRFEDGVFVVEVIP